MFNMFTAAPELDLLPPSQCISTEANSTRRKLLYALKNYIPHHPQLRKYTVDAPIIHRATLSKDLAVWRTILEDEASETDLPDLVDFPVRAIPEATHIYRRRSAW
jgi:hypothetical protein